MGEVLYRPERFRELIPSEEEIRSAFEELLDGREFKEVRKKEDDEGIYLWEIETKDSRGDLVEYSYLRKGRKAEGGGTVETVINVTFHDSSGYPTTGSCAAKYVNGRWKIIK